MFRVGTKVRLIIIVDWKTVGSVKGGGIVEIAVGLHKLFGADFKNIVNSCLLIITKIQ